MLSNGGWIFLIPYTFFTVFLGYPIHFLETSIGQYSQMGPLRIWDMAPIGRGIGFAGILLCFILGYINNIIPAYSLMYFAECFSSVYLWTDCELPRHMNRTCIPRMITKPNNSYQTPSEFFFYNRLLQSDYQTPLLSNSFGQVLWRVLLCYLYSWFIVFLGTYKGVRSVEKVSFYLALIPYCCLIGFVSMSIQIHGFGSSFAKGFAVGTPGLLWSAKTWLHAAQQVFFELGLGQGTLIAYGSYCYHRNAAHIDSAIVVIVNYFLSLVSSFIVFSCVGILVNEKMTNMLAQDSESIGTVAGIFILYTETFAKLDGQTYICFITFSMFFCATISSQIAVIQTLICIIVDQFPKIEKNTAMISFALCLGLGFIGISLCTNTGAFIVDLVYAVPGKVRVPISVCFVIVVVLIYGVNKYCEDMHFLLDYYPSQYFIVSIYAAPFIMSGVYAYHLVKSETSTALNEYSSDAILMARIVMWAIFFVIPIYGIYWFILCAYTGIIRDMWRSKSEWGPDVYKARIARAFFDSSYKRTISVPWKTNAIDFDEY